MAQHDDTRVPQATSAIPGELAGPAASISDRRIKPRGVLPRSLQTWLMAGTAVVVVLIILITGHPAPTPRPQVGTRPADAALAPADRIKNYAQQLVAEEARRQAALAEADPAAARSGRATSSGSSTPLDVAGPTATGAAADAERKRAVTSLFADNVVLSHRVGGLASSASTDSLRPTSTYSPGSAISPDSPAASLTAELARLEQALTQASTAALAGRGLASPSPLLAPAPLPAAPPAPVPPSSSASPSAPSSLPATSAPRTETPAPGPRLRILEGTVIETVLLTRLDGTFAGPVSCLVTTPVYSADRQQVLIPAGARVLGSAAAVQSWGDSRLAVSFHRLLMPDGHTYSLDVFKGLDQVGETGVKEAVNHHYMQVFGASVAIGALAGLSQFNARGNIETATFSEQYFQGAGNSLASSAARVLDRYLNVLPTITIREGYRIKVYLTNDFELPAYPSSSGQKETGGIR